MSGGVTLDAGALIAFERSDRRVVALLARCNELGAVVTIPSTALAQVIRQPPTQARLMRLLRQPTSKTVPLDRAGASRVGQLLRRTRTDDIVDAHVVVCARDAGQPVVTGDRADLVRLDAALKFVEI